MNKIHKPGKKFSNVPFGNKNNPMTFAVITDDILITTETWDEALPQTMNFGNNKPYKLVMKWEKNKNYAVTKVLNGKNELVSYYVDVCSPITKYSSIFELTDWYLDVEKYPNKPARLLDEDEFHEAIKSGYLTQEEIKTAQQTAKDVMKLLNHNALSF